MTVIGFIGSGNIGSAVARLAVAAGYDVVMSNSRGPETLSDLVGELGDPASAGTVTEAATQGDIVVVTIPYGKIGDIPVEPLAGKVVIDTNNYYPDRDGRDEALDRGETTSSEVLQRHLPTSHVVKTFNNIMYTHLKDLARPVAGPDRSALAIAGDDPAAKKTVTEFLDRIGYDAVDAGPLADSWRYEPDTPAYGLVYFGPQGYNGDPAPAGAAKIEQALAAATRTSGR